MSWGSRRRTTNLLNATVRPNPLHLHRPPAPAGRRRDHQPAERDGATEPQGNEALPAVREPFDRETGPDHREQRGRNDHRQRAGDGNPNQRAAQRDGEECANR